MKWDETATGELRYLTKNKSVFGDDSKHSERSDTIFGTSLFRGRTKS